MNISNSSKYTNDDHPGSLASQEYNRDGAGVAATTPSSAGVYRRMIGKKTKQHPRIPLSPIRREITSATWTHSSCSSRSLYSDQHHFHPSPTGSRRRTRPDTANPVCSSSSSSSSSRYTRANIIADDFGSLSRLSLRYRDGCLSMDEGQRQNGPVAGDDKSSYSVRIHPSTLERFLISLETLRDVPLIPVSGTVSPPSAAANNKISLLPKRSRRHEPLSDADRKPAAKKTSPTHQSMPPLSPYRLPVAPPASRQLKEDPLHTEQGVRRRNSHANIAPCPSTKASSPSSEDQVWSVTTIQPTPEEVLRQQAILDAIQRERRLAEVQGVRPVVPLPSRSSPPRQPAARSSPQDTNAAVSANSQRRASCNRGTAKKNPASSPSTMSMVDDRVANLGNGKKLRLKGTKHAYKSILQGQATIVQCPCCHIMLQISATAKNLYCTGCHQVSPILLDDSSLGAAGGGTTGGPTNCHSSELDHRIAHALQRQEIHVSQTVKHAKA